MRETRPSHIRFTMKYSLTGKLEEQETSTCRPCRIDEIWMVTFEFFENIMTASFIVLMCRKKNDDNSRTFVPF